MTRPQLVNYQLGVVQHYQHASAIVDYLTVLIYVATRCQAVDEPVATRCQAVDEPVATRCQAVDESSSVHVAVLAAVTTQATNI